MPIVPLYDTNNVSMNTHFSKWIAVGSLLALLGAGCTGSEPAVEIKPITPPTTKVDTKPVDTSVKPVDIKPVDTQPEAGQPLAETPTPDTAMSPDRVVDPKELPIIDSSWKTYSNTALNFSFQYPTKGRFAPEWEVQLMSSLDERLSGNCLLALSERRTPNSTIAVGDSTFCVVREVDAGAGQRFYKDSYTVPRGERIVLITFTKRLANGDMFEDVACHGKVVISSGTTCIPFDEALYRAHLNQIVSTYRHE